MLRPPERETQALFRTLTGTVRMPSLLFLEVAWRWLYGIPALWVLWGAVQSIVAQVPAEKWAALQQQAYNPQQASILLAEIAVAIWPALLAKLWLAGCPLLLGWVCAWCAGRWLVTKRLRRLGPQLVPQPRSRVPLYWFVLQAGRIALLAAVFALFFVLVRAAARDCFPAGAAPNLVLYLAIVVVTAVGMFGAWGVLSWAVSVAPAVAAAQPGLSFGQVLRRSWRVRGVVEANLVLSIIKLALIVLAMVFSAVPVPFAEEVTPQMFHIWWACVTVWYLFTGDYFQVARWVEMLRLAGAETSLVQ